MNKVFVGGSRRISRLSAEVRQRLDRIIDNSLDVIIGDANGADKAVQAYLSEKGYSAVEVFCSGSECRNNVASWPVRSISADKRRRSSFYSTKDRAMADEASYGLMIWDGKSIGTLMNVFRLVQRDKPVVVFVAPDKQFSELKDWDAWKGFIAAYAPTMEWRLRERAVGEEGDTSTDDSQSRLL